MSHGSLWRSRISGENSVPFENWTIGDCKDNIQHVGTSVADHPELFNYCIKISGDVKIHHRRPLKAPDIGG